MERRSLGSSLLVPSVQELAKEHISEVPPRYVRTDQDPVVTSWLTSARPKDPIIDMQRLLSPDSADYELERLHLACRDWGFFQLKNHGLSDSLLEKLKAETQEFFNLPLDEKNKYWQQAGDIEGFGQAFVVSEEQKLDWADMFYLVTLPHEIRRPHLFPKLPLPFRDTLEAYSSEVNKVSLNTLMFIAKASKMDVEEMKALFEEGMQSMRMNYYPPCPQPEKVIGLSPHSDPQGITFLVQVNEVEGLEIKKDGIWMPVKPLPNSFIVNIGDTLEMVTNGLYKSIEHRAIVNSEKERLSIATFFAPKLDGEIGPASSLITPENPPKFKRVTVVNLFKNIFARELYSKGNIEQYYL
ncbi:putative codeine 3-O-demethylase [Helianthus anomalus]